MLQATGLNEQQIRGVRRLRNQPQDQTTPWRNVGSIAYCSSGGGGGDKCRRAPPEWHIKPERNYVVPWYSWVNFSVSDVFTANSCGALHSLVHAIRILGTPMSVDVERR